MCEIVSIKLTLYLLKKQLCTHYKGTANSEINIKHLKIFTSNIEIFS